MAQDIDGAVTMARKENHECTACALGEALERREFVRDAVARVVAVLGTLGIASSPASAMAVSFARGHGPRADRAYTIPAKDGVVIDKDESVIIARVGDRVFAFSLACPHQNTALRWDSGNNRFQCPKHKSRYRPDGSFIDGRATRGMDRFAVKRSGDTLLVNLDALYREDENAAQWAGAFISMTEK